MSKVENIKDIVQKVIGSLSIKTQHEQEAVVEAWKKITSKKEQEHTEIEGFKDGTLIVKFDSSAWLYQMNLKNKKILEELQKNFPEVKKIYFKLGKTN